MLTAFLVLATAAAGEASPLEPGSVPTATTTLAGWYDSGTNLASEITATHGGTGVLARPLLDASGLPVASGAERLAPRGASSPGRARLAGEAGSVPGGPTARPDIVLSGGRGGGQVKSLTGPPDSILSGHGGRIYVTDGEGRVVLDITRDRVKPVVPGQGFGSKRPPTPEELSWIDPIWGSGQ